MTASLVPYCLYAIREGFTKMIDSEDVSDIVKQLVKKLLEDFDKRYEPLNGKVQFKNQVILGHGNRYVHLHKFYFLLHLLILE